MIRALATALVVTIALGSSTASAQVFYEPVRYQHGDQNAYYYAGNNPAMHRYAQFPVGGGGTYGRVNGYDFTSGSIHTNRSVASERVRVFSDLYPFRDARNFGYTAADARNDVDSSVPTHFRKSDALKSAIRESDGTLRVPSRPAAEALYYAPARATASQAASQPSRAPRPIMIIPKDQFDAPPTAPVRPTGPQANVQ
jgi:hypothetical protein